MFNNYLQPNIDNLQAFSYAFKMTFGNNQNYLNLIDNLAKTQFLNQKNNSINMNLNNLNSSSIIQLNQDSINPLNWTLNSTYKISLIHF